MRYWLMKSEPDEFSIDDLERARAQTTAWFGVRNYQARNYMRDEMRVGDRAFFYHSSCAEPGIAGVVEISKLAYPDATQFDPKGPYYDAKSTHDAPRWVNVDVKLVRKTPLITVPTLRSSHKPKPVSLVCLGQSAAGGANQSGNRPITSSGECTNPPKIRLTGGNPRVARKEFTGLANARSTTSLSRIQKNVLLIGRGTLLSIRTRPWRPLSHRLRNNAGCR